MLQLLRFRCGAPAGRAAHHFAMPLTKHSQPLPEPA